MKYGTRLRELIEKHGLKQAEVAEKINVSKSTVSFWINAEYPRPAGQFASFYRCIIEMGSLIILRTV